MPFPIKKKPVPGAPQAPFAPASQPPDKKKKAKANPLASALAGLKAANPKENQ
jgi:hypothetical protein